MRHLICLNSTALLDCLQRNEIWSSRVIDVVGRGPPDSTFVFWPWQQHHRRSLSQFISSSSLVIYASFSATCPCWAFFDAIYAVTLFLCFLRGFYSTCTVLFFPLSLIICTIRWNQIKTAISSCSTTGSMEDFFPAWLNTFVSVGEHCSFIKQFLSERYAGLSCRSVLRTLLSPVHLTVWKHSSSNTAALWLTRCQSAFFA